MEKDNAGSRGSENVPEKKNRVGKTRLRLISSC